MKEHTTRKIGELEEKIIKWNSTHLPKISTMHEVVFKSFLIDALEEMEDE